MVVMMHLMCLVLNSSKVVLTDVVTGVLILDGFMVIDATFGPHRCVLVGFSWLFLVTVTRRLLSSRFSLMMLWRSWCCISFASFFQVSLIGTFGDGRHLGRFLDRVK